MGENEWHRHSLCLRLATGMQKLPIRQSPSAAEKEVGEGSACGAGREETMN